METHNNITISISQQTDTTMRNVLSLFYCSPVHFQLPSPPEGTEERLPLHLRTVYTQETRHSSLGLHSTASVDSCLTARFFPRLPLGPPLLPCLSRKVIDEKPFPYFSLADSTRLFSTDVPCEDSSQRDGFLFKPSNEASMRWKLCRADCSCCSGPD